MMANKMLGYAARLMLIMAVMGLPLPGLQQNAKAQISGGNWTDFVNISRTATASTYPCITTDAAGNVHVLWSEAVGGRTKNLTLNRDGSPQVDFRGNPLNQLTDAGNTLYYTRWDGAKWHDPIDVQINPNGVLEYPAAAVDPSGILHVVWAAGEGAQTRLYYSQVQASHAESAHEWSTPTVLAESVLYAYYPTGIVTDLTGGTHIIYSQVGAEPGAYIINSSDGGNTWSAPTQLYATTGSEEGVSTMGLVADRKNRLHATWTRFDATGNGKGIYYSQSRDLGRTWSKPVEVAAWQAGWYEVDWLTVGVVEDEVHLVWEGSAEVANLNERISYDGGLTWGISRHIFPNLVGENGFANLVTDSGNQLHLLVVQRGVMASEIHGIWFSHWENDHWQNPVLLGTNNPAFYDIVGTVGDMQKQLDLMRGNFGGGGLRYQKSTILNGNELFVAVVNEWDGEIWVSHTTLSAPLIRPQPYAQPSVTSTPAPVLQVQPVPTPAPTRRNPINATQGREDIGAGDPILIGVLPVLILVVGALVYVATSRRSRV